MGRLCDSLVEIWSKCTLICLPVSVFVVNFFLWIKWADSRETGKWRMEVNYVMAPTSSIMHYIQYIFSPSRLCPFINLNMTGRQSVSMVWLAESIYHEIPLVPLHFVKGKVLVFLDGFRVPVFLGEFPELYTDTHTHTGRHTRHSVCSDDNAVRQQWWSVIGHHTVTKSNFVQISTVYSWNTVCVCVCECADSIRSNVVSQNAQQIYRCIAIYKVNGNLLNTALVQRGWIEVWARMRQCVNKTG